MRGRPGTRWSAAQISERQAVLRAAGYEWDVVESLPVSEAIKTQGALRCGALSRPIRPALKRSRPQTSQPFATISCPSLDWTRTNLRAEQPHGGAAMRFDLIDFAAFDLHILQREEGVESYSEAQRAAAAERFNALSDHGKKQLQRNIIAGLPGANDSWSLGDVRALLDSYKGITRAQLRSHLIDFLSEVAPCARRWVCACVVTLTTRRFLFWACRG